MLDFQQKRKVRNMMYHRATLIVLGILVLFSLHSVWTVFDKERESGSLSANAAKRVADLEAREGELHSQIDRLQTPEGVEAEIRSKFSVAKDNENIVVIVDDQSSTTATTTSQENFWHKIIHFFER